VSLFLNSRDGVEALRKFPAVPADNPEQIVRFALNKLNPLQRTRFYTEVLPEIYGELLEDLGDAHGLEKMGLDEAPVHALAFLHHVIFDKPGAPDAWSKEEWQAMAAQVEPETLARLRDLATAQGQTEALESLTEASSPPTATPPFRRAAQPLTITLGGEGLHR
jgi:hypothetical protein